MPKDKDEDLIEYARREAEAARARGTDDSAADLEQIARDLEAKRDGKK